MKKFCVVLSFIFLSIMLGGFSVVCAQDDESEAFMLEEITVTAEKREQNLQKTAMSIEVMQGC